MHVSMISFLAIYCLMVSACECRSFIFSRRDALEHKVGDATACSGLPQAAWDDLQHVYKAYYVGQEETFKTEVNRYFLVGMGRILDPLSKADVWEFGCTVAGTDFIYLNLYTSLYIINILKKNVNV